MIGTPTGQTQQVAMYPAGAVFIEKPSSAPTVIGILMVISGLLAVAGGALQLIGAPDVIEALDEANALLDDPIDFPVWLLYAEGAVNLLTGIAFIGGGVLLMQRKKLGSFLGLGAVGLSVIFGVIKNSMLSDVYTKLDVPDPGAAGLIITVVCNAICGLIIALPLMISSSRLE